MYQVYLAGAPRFLGESQTTACRWIFETLDPVVPQVVRAVPENGATDGARDGALTIYYDQALLEAADARPANGANQPLANPPAAITLRDVDAYVPHCWDCGHVPTTVNRRLAALPHTGSQPDLQKSGNGGMLLSMV